MSAELIATETMRTALVETTGAVARQHASLVEIIGGLLAQNAQAMAEMCEARRDAHQLAAQAVNAISPQPIIAAGRKRAPKPQPRREPSADEDGNRFTDGLNIV